MNHLNKIIIAGICSLLGAVLIFFTLSIPYTVFEIKADAITPFGEITTSNPFEYCIEKNLRLLSGAEEFQLFLATYQRINTSHYDFDLYMRTDKTDILSEQSESKTALFHASFFAQDLKDNTFYSFRIPQFQVNPLCMSLSSGDAVPGNAITVWLNSQKQPVLKIVSNVSLAKMLEQPAASSFFHSALFPSGNIWVSAIFFGYLFVQIFLAVYLLFYLYESKSAAISVHPARTDQS